MWSQSPSSAIGRFGSVRGASSFGVTSPKIYVDGIEVANPLVLTQFDPERIERVEVIRGPQGAALYGSGAISGVVNIITRHDGARAGDPIRFVRTRARGCPPANMQPAVRLCRIILLECEPARVRDHSDLASPLARLAITYRVARRDRCWPMPMCAWWDRVRSSQASCGSQPKTREQSQARCCLASRTPHPPRTTRRTISRSVRSTGQPLTDSRRRKIPPQRASNAFASGMSTRPAVSRNRCSNTPLAPPARTSPTRAGHTRWWRASMATACAA